MRGLACPLRFRTFILRLLQIGRPFAVFGRIGTIIVDSFQCKHWIRSLSHIREKCTEVITPAVAYRNSTSTVVFVGRGVLVVTTLAQMIPAGILGRQPHSVSSATRCKLFLLQPSARLTKAITQVSDEIGR